MKQIFETWLGQGDLASFIVGNIIETLRNDGNGDTFAEKDQEALDNSIRDKAKLRRSTRREDEWPLAYPHISLVGARYRRYPNRHRRKPWTVCREKGRTSRQSFRDRERKFAMTAVNRKTSDKTGSAGDNVYTPLRR